MSTKNRKLGLLIFILIFLVVILPLIYIGISFIGRISPDSVIPDSFAAYTHIPNPIQLADRLLAHEPFSDIISTQSFSNFYPVISKIKNSGILEKRWVRFAGKGPLDGALFSDGKFLAAWDSGIAAPFIRFFPNLTSSVTIKNLYYVQAGKKSRFEYRADDNNVVYMQRYKNLLIISNNLKLFESVLDGTSRDADLRGSKEKKFLSSNFDAGFLVASESVAAEVAESSSMVGAVLKHLKFSGFAELTLSFFPNQIDVAISSPVISDNADINKIISRDSKITTLVQQLPGATQYSTVFSIGSLEELLNISLAVYKQKIPINLKKIDATSRMFIGVGLDDLLFSWTGTEMAVLGLEGRPYPIFVLQVTDEQKRKEIFNKVFSSAVVDENISVVLDGTRIPQIKLPGFLNVILSMWNIKIPAPYYIVQNGFLFISESPESLLSAANSIRKNDILPKTDLWKSLSKAGSDKSSLTLFYSLDRSLPFFIKGNDVFEDVLKLYRQGLVRVNINNNIFTAALSAVPGYGKGIRQIPGYPLELGEKTGNKVYSIFTGKKDDSRILLSKEKSAISINPQNNKIYEYKSSSNVWCLPSSGLPLGTITAPAAWVINEDGVVTLVNGNMEPVKGFPLITGCRLTSAPAAYNSKLFLPDTSGVIFVVDAFGSISPISFPFKEPLRSPPSFMTTSRNSYMAAYPKSFIGEIWLSDIAGNVYSGWPVAVPSIAFGSPVLFAKNEKLFVSFITQAGELSVFDEKGNSISGFPIEIPGIFYIQPAYDGEALWAISSEGVLYKISMNGNVLQQTIPGFKAEEGAIITADIDNDKTPEIFITGSGNALYGYSNNFTLLDGFPLPVWGNPAFGDFNGDGNMECIGIGLDNRLYRWQFR